MDFIINYWYIIVAAVALAVVGIVLFIKFLRTPRAEQVKKVKEWLLVAVMEAEDKFGGGTGQIKLRYVYDIFVRSFPWVAKIVTFETFSQWVDEALDKAEDWLKE